MKASFDEWKPFITMIAIDFAFAVVNILLKEVLIKGIADRSSHFMSYVTSSAVPLLGASVAQYLFLLGIHYTSATFACAFVNMVPVITFVMALPSGIERASPRCSSGRAKIAGSLVCVGGALLLILHRGMPVFKHSGMHDDMRTAMEHDSGRTERWTLGSMALITGGLLWSLSFFIQLNLSGRYPCQYSNTAIASFFGPIQSAVLSLSTGRNLSMWVLKGKMQIIRVLYAGVIGSGPCFVGMSWCVKKKGSAFTAAFSPLVQIMVAMFDILILREQLHLGRLLDSIIVINGLYFLLWGMNSELHIQNGSSGNQSTGGGTRD